MNYDSGPDIAAQAKLDDAIERAERAETGVQDMADVLLAIEWSRPSGHDGEFATCPSCHGYEPEQWRKDPRLLPPEGSFLYLPDWHSHLAGHKADCAWGAALRKAGVR